MYLKNQQTLFRSLYSTRDNNIEEVLYRLKTLDASQIQCVRLLIDELGLSLAEADSIVLNSEAWQADREAAEKFRSDFGDFLDSESQK